MNIIPQNRHLSVSPIEEEEKSINLSIVLPTDYKKPVNPHIMCKVIDVAADSKFYNQIKANDTIIVERRMLNKIEFNGKTSYLLLENYIFGSIK